MNTADYRGLDIMARHHSLCVMQVAQLFRKTLSLNDVSKLFNITYAKNRSIIYPNFSDNQYDYFQEYPVKEVIIFSLPLLSLLRVIETPIVNKLPFLSPIIRVWSL